MEGCPGVEPTGGKAMNMRNNGGNGIGAIGGKTDRVETRTIIKVPDYKIRRFLRTLGLGGTRINISHEKADECEDNKQVMETVFKSGSAHECKEAFFSDLKNAPRGLNLQIAQCQDRFCNDDFLEVFKSFLKDNPQYKVKNPELFLGCDSASIEI